jgi:type II secretory pathway pseudopilin PulG
MSTNKGLGMVEIVVSIAIITLIGTFAVTAWNQYINVTKTSSHLIQAALLTEETGEALIVWRDMGWDSMIEPLTLNTPYYLVWNGSAYATSTSAVALQGNYAARFTLSSVYRDSNSSVVTSGGTVDTDTLKASVVVVSLADPTTPLATSELLIHNIYAN